jgi:hypothetical protein
LQQGLEKRNLNTRVLVDLLIRQLLATTMDTVSFELMYYYFFNKLKFRNKAVQYLNTRLHQQLELGLLEGFLELDISEMEDFNTTLCFSEARRLIEQEGICIFTKQLNLIGQCTSIVACMLTLASLVTRKSWPILAFTASLPLFDKATAMVLSMFSRNIPRIYLFFVIL